MDQSTKCEGCISNSSNSDDCSKCIKSDNVYEKNDPFDLKGYSLDNNYCIDTTEDLYEYD